MNATSSDQDNDFDQSAEAEIADCLDPSAPKSFFLFAGAGSGKTRSLVNALNGIRASRGAYMRQHGQRVGVITYTNAACDEIIRRVQFDPLFDVRTIHSFAWSIVEGLNKDIRSWLQQHITTEIEELRRLEAGGRPSKASDERKAKLASYTRRLELLPGVSRFIYSPTGVNRTRDSLNHSEVLKLASHFLMSKQKMQAIFVGRYPILLVDESQDTNKALVDALFEVDAKHSGAFTLGLIGDMMQRIYADGKEELGRELPVAWARPAKAMNHRCPKRIVDLLNKVRAPVDTHKQRSRSDAAEGTVRLFITEANHPDTSAFEDDVARTMAHLTDDAFWTSPDEVKTLTLEHRMAARRLGCPDVFGALYELDNQSLLSGTMGVANFFAAQVLPIVEAKHNGDRFGLMRVVKSYSPLMSTESLRANPGRASLEAIQAAVDSLDMLFADGRDPTLLEVLRAVAKTGLLEVPERLVAWSMPPGDGEAERAGDEEDAATCQRVEAIERLLSAPFSQVAPLRDYLEKRTRFDTHQGVKGLEFDRVMVIMDDHEARGFSFKYDDLFGSKTDGKVLEATRRLFYVVASRAKKSLALIAYTDAPGRVHDFALQSGWFAEDEVIVR